MTDRCNCDNPNHGECDYCREQRERANKRRAYMETVMVYAVPEPSKRVDRKLGPCELPGWATFRVHTSGLVQQYGRAELELRRVPALYVDHACKLLNGWGLYSTETPISEGQTLSDPETLVKVLLVAHPSQHPSWKGRPALELRAVACATECASCGQPMTPNEHNCAGEA